jgi:hypothetical protein
MIADCTTRMYLEAYRHIFKSLIADHAIAHNHEEDGASPKSI